MTPLRRLGLLAVLCGCTTFEGASVGEASGSGGAGQAGSLSAGGAAGNAGGGGASGAGGGAGQAGAGGQGGSGAGQAGAGGAGQAGAGQAGEAGVSGSSGQSGAAGQAGQGGAGAGGGSGEAGQGGEAGAGGVGAPVALPFDEVVRQPPAYTGPQPFTPQVLARSVHVAGEGAGDDDSEGTEAKPLRSLAGVEKYLKSQGSAGGLSIRLRRGGRVRGSLRLTGGSPLDPIVIGPYGDPSEPPPELNDEEPSPALTLGADGLHSAVLPRGVQRVFARYKGTTIEAERAWLAVTSATFSGGYLSGPALLQRPELAQDLDAIAVWSNNSDKTRTYRLPTAYDPAKGLLLSPSPGDGAGVEVVAHNHPAFIDLNFEWWQAREAKDGGRRFAIKLPAGETPESVQLRVIPEGQPFPMQSGSTYEPTTATIVLDSVSAVTIEGLRFRRPASIAIGVARGDGVTVQHCAFDDLDAPALVSRSAQGSAGGTKNLVVDRNEMTGVNLGMVRLADTIGARVTGNRATAGPGRDRRGLLDGFRLVATTDTLIASNHVHGARARALSTYSNSGLVIEKNIFIDPAQKNMDDFALVFQAEASAAKPVQVRQNVFYAGGTPNTSGLRMMGSSTSGAIEGNLMVTPRGGITLALDGATTPAWSVLDNTLLVTQTGVTAHGGVSALRGNHLELLKIPDSSYAVAVGATPSGSVGDVSANAYIARGTKPVWQSCSAPYKCTYEDPPSWLDPGSPVLRDDWYTLTPSTQFVVFNPSLEPAIVLAPGTSGAWHGLVRGDDGAFTIEEWAAGAPLTVPAFGWRVLQQGPRP